ncbi:MAG TPA: cytochrome c [Calditrichaeota bacterium]|nr:cytochrome c [Calditrichota bacterium]
MSAGPGSNWNAPPEADQLKNPFENDKEAWKKVETTFQTLCMICHGEKGYGDGIAGMALTPRPANLTSEEVQKQSDGAIFWKLTNGNPPMASYKETLTEEQRWQLVKYIRYLGSK